MLEGGTFMAERAQTRRPLIDRLKQLEPDELFEVVRGEAAKLPPDDLFIQAAIDNRLDPDERLFFDELMADPAWTERYKQLTGSRSSDRLKNQSS
jgi:hypothetical protein